MQFDFVFADLQVQVSFDADNTGSFGQLTDKDLTLLRNVVYMGLCTFMYSKMPGVQMFIDDVRENPDKELQDTDIVGGG